MASKLGHGKIVDGHADPRSLRGVERRRQMLAEDAAEVARISSHLLDTLHRPPTIEDEMKAALIAKTSVRIDRLDEQRRNSLPERKLLEDLLRTPFNAPSSTLGPRVEGSGQTFFVAEKGDKVAADEATAPDEASK